MDDMNAFERQVAGEFVRRAGPVRPVNAAAIFTAITATQSPTWRFQSMFSATKFVVAGAIVALFGGFLLAGLLAQPSEERLPAAGASASAEAIVTAEPTDEQADSATLAGTFSSVESLAGAPSGTSTLLPDGRVLIVGDARAEVWDPATGTRTPAGSMSMSRPNHGAVGLADGRVLIVSEDEYPAAPSAEVWDPATRSFSPAGSFSEWHSGLRPSLTLLQGGRVLVMGGGEHHMDATQVVEVWDPQTEAFRVAGEMIENRAEQSATLLQDGRVLIVGGEVEDPGEASLSPGEPRGCSVCETPAALAEIWDPETESFSSAGSLSQGRAGHTATLLQDGRVLIIGGGDTYDQETPSAEIWDPATETFSPAGSLHEERIFHTATLLPDGRVLVIGGSSTVGQNLVYPASAEIWDPATASFSPAGSLVSPRRWHNATLLPDGRVLVMGGRANAEMWEPATDESPADAETTAATTPDLLPGVDLSTYGRPIELPAEIPVGIDSGTLDTPAGPAHWVHLAGDETTLPAQWAPMVQTPDGFVVAELGATPAQLWRSPDLLEWTPEPLGIEADYGDLWQSGAGFWLSPEPGDELWRSADTRTWERVPLEAVSPPSPYAGARALSADPPAAHDGTELIPFTWYLPFPGPLERYLDPDGEWPDDIEEVDPGVYEFTPVGASGDERIRLEETDGGVRLLAADGGEDATELGFFEGFTVDVLQRVFTDGVEGIRGLLLLENGELVTVPAPGGDEGWWELAITSDDQGFLSYSLGDDGLIHVHRSQDGRDWVETDLIGDDPSEPTDAVSVHRWGEHVVIEDDRTWWIATDDGGWRTMGPTPDLWARPLGDGWVQGPLESRVDGPPDTAWYQPREGKPVRFDISRMGIPQEPCGGGESFISSNTVVTTSAGPDCDGRREVWILTFDDVPA